MRNPRAVGGYSYRIVNKNSGPAANDADFQTAAALVGNALDMRGMYPASPPASAEVVVEIDYWVGPQRLKVETSPGNPVTIDPITGREVLPGTERMITDASQIGGATISGRPVRAIQTTRNEVEVKTVFEKHMTIVAREAAPEKGPGGTGPEIWRVEATLEDTKNEVQSYLPVLVTAVSDLMGENNGRRETVRVTVP